MISSVDSVLTLRSGMDYFLFVAQKVAGVGWSEVGWGDLWLCQKGPKVKDYLSRQFQCEFLDS